MLSIKKTVNFFFFGPSYKFEEEIIPVKNSYYRDNFKCNLKDHVTIVFYCLPGTWFPAYD